MPRMSISLDEGASGRGHERRFARPGALMTAFALFACLRFSAVDARVPPYFADGAHSTRMATPACYLLMSPRYDQYTPSLPDGSRHCLITWPQDRRCSAVFIADFGDANKPAHDEC